MPRLPRYCSLLWTLFEDHCNYYKELLKLYQILDREECFTIREAYTNEECRRITWAIIDEGCLFFGWNPVAPDFVPGAQIYFSTSFLKGIKDTICNALIIQWTTFLCEWLSLAVPELTYGAPCTLTPAGPPSPTRWQAPAPAPSPPALGQAKKEDILHPK